MSLGFNVRTKVQNYTGFSPMQLIIVVATWCVGRKRLDLPKRSYHILQSFSKLTARSILIPTALAPRTGRRN
jgi:hypothetical protein